MKKLERKLRELDDAELAALQEAIHGELARRHPAPDFAVKSHKFRVIEGDDANDDYDSDDSRQPRRRRA